MASPTGRPRRSPSDRVPSCPEEHHRSDTRYGGIHLVTLKESRTAESRTAAERSPQRRRALGNWLRRAPGNWLRRVLLLALWPPPPERAVRRSARA